MKDQHRSPSPTVAHALRASDAVLAIDMSDVRIANRAPQVIVGWCRAAFAQIQAIATLLAAGVGTAHGPNLRLLLESEIRLLWLNSLPVEQRAAAVDELLDHERSNTKRTIEGVRAAGFDVEFDLDEMLEFPLDSTSKGRLFDQAKNFTAAAKAAKVDVMYALWRETSGLAHASGRLAGDYAPVKDKSRLGAGEPEPLDPSLETLAETMLLIVSVTAALLVDEGVDKELAGRFLQAYLSVDSD